MNHQTHSSARLALEYGYRAYGADSPAKAIAFSLDMMEAWYGDTISMDDIRSIVDASVSARAVRHRTYSRYCDYVLLSRPIHMKALIREAQLSAFPDPDDYEARRALSVLVKNSLSGEAAHRALSGSFDEWLGYDTIEDLLGWAPWFCAEGWDRLLEQCK